VLGNFGDVVKPIRRVSERVNVSCAAVSWMGVFSAIRRAESIRCAPRVLRGERLNDLIVARLFCLRVTGFSFAPRAKPEDVEGRKSYRYTRRQLKVLG